MSLIVRRQSQGFSLMNNKSFRKVVVHHANFKGVVIDEQGSGSSLLGFATDAKAPSGYGAGA